MMKSWPCVVATGIALSVLAAARPAGAGGVAPVCSGLIAEWKFEGNGADTSNNGNNGTVFSPAYAPGVAGQALQLDGVGTYAAFPDSPSLNPTAAMTISAWYFAVPFSGSGNDPIVDKGAPSHSYPYYQYHMGVSGTQYNPPGAVGTTFAINGNPTGAGTNGGTLINGVWKHYVATFDGSECRFYVDGELVSSNPASGTITNYGRPVLVGRFVNLSFFFLPGAVDEVRLFDRAVSPEEVELLYRSPDARPVVVPPAFNTCPGGTVTLTARHLATSGVTYQWRRNGQELNAQTGPTLTIVNASNNDAATYDCIVTTPCAQQASRPATVTLCIGDLNADGQRNTADLTAFLGSFGQTVTPCSRGDLNADGIVNTLDLTTFLGRFGQACQ